MFLGFWFTTHLLTICDVTHVSNAGSWTRVSRVKAEYPNQLDYNGTYTKNKFEWHLTIICVLSEIT